MMRKRYRTGRYEHERVGSKRGVIRYRYIKTPRGRRVLIGVTARVGPRGGRTKLISILRPIKRRKRYV